jgi:uncharacterized protein
MDLRRVFQLEGEAQVVDCTVDFSKLGAVDGSVFIGNVSVQGSAENRSGVVRLSYSAEFELTRCCDRCLAETKEKKELSFSHVIALSVDDFAESDAIEAPDYNLDLEQLVYSDILLTLPMKYLCSEDCRGLCSLCGANLNEGDCGCRPHAIDPRLAILKELL